MTIEDLKNDRPDIVELFEGLSHEELIVQAYKECIDAIQMQQRVAVFMETCTLDMSNTNYTEASIRSMVQSAKDSAEIEFCYQLTVDNENDQEIADAVHQMALEI